MAIEVGGLCGILVFYVLILMVGVVAGHIKNRRLGTSSSGPESVIIAGRDIGLFIGVFTMTATWVGGGYIMGITQTMMTEGHGLAWVIIPFGFCMTLIIGCLFFMKPMRERLYITMLDPFQEQYGSIVGGLMIIPAFCGELFWCAAILSALGSTISIILGLKFWISVVISAAVAGGYTLFGGMFSVAFTDVVQLVCIVFGLVLAIPFAWYNENVDMSLDTLNHTLWTTDWRGMVTPNMIGMQIDMYLLFIMGGIPWQSTFQRVLSAKSVRVAQISTFIGAFMIMILAIPSLVVGVIAKHTDWNATPISYEQMQASPYLAMPAVLAYLTPKSVSFFGLGAISAAVMSSADSTILGCSSMFAHNVYRNIFRKRASDCEMVTVLRIGIVVCAGLACAIAIKVESINGLFILAGDVVYILLFPQFFLVIYLPRYSNSYGVVVGCFMGLLIRLLAGEPLFGIDTVIKFPYYYAEISTQGFPYRTVSMLINLVTNVLISVIMSMVFVKYAILPLKLDILHCFRITEKEKEKSRARDLAMRVHPTTEKL